MLDGASQTLVMLILDNWAFLLRIPGETDC